MKKQTLYNITLFSVLFLFALTITQEPSGIATSQSAVPSSNDTNTAAVVSPDLTLSSTPDSPVSISTSSIAPTNTSAFATSQTSFLDAVNSSNSNTTTNIVSSPDNTAAPAVVANGPVYDRSPIETPPAAIVQKEPDEKTRKNVVFVKPELTKDEINARSARSQIMDEPLGNHIQQFLQPWTPETENERIKVNFQNASLAELMSFMENNYDVTFLTDEALNPAPPGSGKLSASTITFRSHSALNKRELWNLFTTFLDMAGFTVVPGNNPRIFRIVSADPKVANKAPLPSYIGVEYDQLPDSDTKIRYVYFVENADINNLLPVIDSMKNPGTAVVTVPEMRAIMITDRAANIRSIMQIVTELDTVASPEVMSIIRLKKASAPEVAQFYTVLTQEESGGGLMSRLSGVRKEPTTNPFARVRVVADPRTNALFVFGTRESVPLVEDFIRTHIDRDIPVAYGGTQIYRAKYIDAVATAALLKSVVQFDPTSPAAKYGGIRDGEKYFKADLDFVPEKNTNSIIIKGDYEDYLKILEVLKKIDVEQPQVAIRVVVVDVNLGDLRELGTQLRNTNYGIPPSILGPTGLEGVAGKNLTFQTSGLSGNSPIIENPTGVGAARLLGDLVALATGQAGTALFTLGQDAFGVWGIVKTLQRFTSANVIANPFLLTTHNYPARVSVGEQRRVLSGTVSGGAATQAGKTPIDANLSVEVRPLISTDGLINLDVKVNITDFTSPDVNSGNRLIKQVATKALVDNKEILALGGFIRDRVDETKSKIPLLGDIPVLGWLFKNRVKDVNRSSLLILISAEIIESSTNKGVDAFTQDKVDEVTSIISYAGNKGHRRDPIYRWFFNDSDNNELKRFNDFLQMKDTYISEAERLRREQKANPNIIVAQNKKEKKKAVKAQKESSQNLKLAHNTTLSPQKSSKKGKKLLQLIGDENSKVAA